MRGMVTSPFALVAVGEAGSRRIRSSSCCTATALTDGTTNSNATMTALCRELATEVMFDSCTRRA